MKKYWFDNADRALLALYARKHECTFGKPYPCVPLDTSSLTTPNYNSSAYCDDALRVKSEALEILERIDYYG